MHLLDDVVVESSKTVERRSNLCRYKRHIKLKFLDHGTDVLQLMQLIQFPFSPTRLVCSTRESQLKRLD